MQLELKHLQTQLGITFVYVTHDQEEALTMSDRIVLMRQGRIEQVGTPRDLYDRPASRYVADFIGETNLLTGTVVQEGPRPVVLKVGEDLVRGWSDAALPVGSTAWLSVRPEAIQISAESGPATGDSVLTGKIVDAVYSGSLLRVHIALAGGQLIVAHAPAATTPGVGASVRLSWEAERGRCGSD
jgi:spermidine/putrescine transport system ATP-binding protein